MVDDNANSQMNFLSAIQVRCVKLHCGQFKNFEYYNT